jgi:hypothetical protein
VSARAIIDALVAGERDPKVLAELAKRSLRHKIPALIDALEGRLHSGLTPLIAPARRCWRWVAKRK